jgi:hypothetical protein
LDRVPFQTFRHPVTTLEAVIPHACAARGRATIGACESSCGRLRRGHRHERRRARGWCGATSRVLVVAAASDSSIESCRHPRLDSSLRKKAHASNAWNLAPRALLPVGRRSAKAANSQGDERVSELSAGGAEDFSVTGVCL